MVETRGVKLIEVEGCFLQVFSSWLGALQKLKSFRW
jgi:hypothetical protein